MEDHQHIQVLQPGSTTNISAQRKYWHHFIIHNQDREQVYNIWLFPFNLVDSPSNTFTQEELAGSRHNEELSLCIEPFVSKIVEKLVASRLNTYVAQNSILEIAVTVFLPETSQYGDCPSQSPKLHTAGHR